MDIQGDLGTPLSEGELDRIIVVDDRHGWTVVVGEEPGARAQVVSWTFTPDGRLYRHPDEEWRLAWNRPRPEEEVVALLERWSEPVIAAR